MVDGKAIMPIHVIIVPSGNPFPMSTTSNEDPETSKPRAENRIISARKKYAFLMKIDLMNASYLFSKLKLYIISSDFDEW